MKVCLVTAEFPPMQGGVGDYTNELSKALAALGVEVHIITSKPQETPSNAHHAPRNTRYATRNTQHAIRNTPHASRRPQSSVDVLRASYFLHPIVEKWGWGCWRAIAGLVRRERPDILHIQYQAAAYAMHPAINFLPCRMRWGGPARPRTVVTFHDLRVPYLFPKAGPLRWQVVLALARWSDAVIVTNAADQARLKPYPLQPYLIPIGSNIAPRLPDGYDRTAQRASWGIGLDDFLLCHFGFMNERKGIETLLKALSILVNDPSSPCRPWLLMIGGKVGSSDPTNVAYLRRVESLIEELGLKERVLWTDFIPPEEVSACFAAADCCVLPYREGASFQHGTLMAALAHGMAIVTTFAERESQIADGRSQGARGRVQSPVELRDGENVLLVPPDDVQALAAAIKRLARSPELRHRLREGAKELSRSFDWEGIAARHLEVYRALA